MCNIACIAHALFILHTPLIWQAPVQSQLSEATYSQAFNYVILAHEALEEAISKDQSPFSHSENSGTPSLQDLLSLQRDVLEGKLAAETANAVLIVLEETIQQV